MKPVQTLLLALLTVGLLVAQNQSPSEPSAELRAAYLKHLSPVQRDIVAAFDKIAAERGVTVAEVARVFAAMNGNSQGITKGGVGLIRDDVFVIANSRNNEVIAGKDTVTGADSHLPELFVICRGKLIGRLAIPADGTSDVIVTLFTPEKIQFYDWKDFSGGYYKRFREGEPNQPAEPTRATVTPPADAGDRAGGARGSP